MDKIAIIGLGYVGLPLALEFGKKQPTVGFDIDLNRINELKNNIDRTLEADFDDLKSSKQLTYTSDIEEIKDCNIFIITVPTPIDSKNQPDLTPIESSTRMVASILKINDLVIYESTVYPGVTEEVCVPILEKLSGLVFNQHFFCGYSPERINPGDKERTLTKILKITSGSTPEIAQKVDSLYRNIITAGTHLAPSIKVAEAAKVIENTQRDVNIALINELALIFNTMGINTSDVIEAAGTKWNFIKLFPGLVGGHCIGVDPYYLSYKALENGYEPNLILSARQINNSMSQYLGDKAIKLMIKANKKVNGSSILLLGLTFKENCPDIRNTKVIDIARYLKEFGCNVDIYDPWADANESKHHLDVDLLEDNPFEKDKYYDSIICCVGHNEFKTITKPQLLSILTEGEVILDVKGTLQYSNWTL